MGDGSRLVWLLWAETEKVVVELIYFPQEGGTKRKWKTVDNDLTVTFVYRIKRMVLHHWLTSK